MIVNIKCFKHIGEGGTQEIVFIPNSKYWHSLWLATLIEPLQLNLEHGRNVCLEWCRYMIFIVNFDFELIISPCHKGQQISTSCHWRMPLHTQHINGWMKLYYLWVKCYDFCNVSILNCVLERIDILVNLGHAYLIVDRILFYFHGNSIKNQIYLQTYTVILAFAQACYIL